jgi:hypothetical protein
MENMGADVGRPQFRGRYSPRPDYSKIREAATVCQTLLGDGGGAPPAADASPSAAPIA